MVEEFPSWPSFSKEEANKVSEVLLSNKVNYWTGEETRNFEKDFAHWCGTEFAIAVSNGTVALDLALLSLSIGSRNGGDATDEVVVTPRTFLASASCVVNAGACPVFADVDMNSGNITAETISKVITKETKAIILVHLSGWPCDLDNIQALAEKHGIKIIEDCAQAHGATYKGRSVGSFGDVAAWSFCQDKIMTTGGEGGMITTNDSTLWAKMWSYKDHGKSWNAVYNRKHPPGYRWLHESFGTNFRMTEMQAAIGRIQLKKMVEWTDKRTENALSIEATLKPFDNAEGVIRLAPFDEHSASNSSHAYYKYYAYIRPENFRENWDRDRLISEINAQGVPCFHGGCSEVYLEKSFSGTRFIPEERLQVAKTLGETSIMFLVHPTICKERSTKMCGIIKQVLQQAQKI